MFGGRQALPAERGPLARAPDAPPHTGQAQHRVGAGQIAVGVEAVVNGDRLFEQRPGPPLVALLDVGGRRVL